MLRKIKFVFISSLLCSTVYSQVGVNTNKPKSTIDVNGSIGTKIREVTRTETLTDDDYLISYTGSSDDAVLTLPPLTKGDKHGRNITIKNLSTATIGTLVIKPSANNHIRNEYSSDNLNSLSIRRGESVKLVANTSYSKLIWDLMSYSGKFIQVIPESFNTKDIIFNSLSSMTVTNNNKGPFTLAEITLQPSVNTNRIIKVEIFSQLLALNLLASSSIATKYYIYVDDKLYSNGPMAMVIPSGFEDSYYQYNHTFFLNNLSSDVPHKISIKFKRLNSIGDGAKVDLHVNKEYNSSNIVVDYPGTFVVSVLEK